MNLSFANIQFYGIDSIEPVFSPEVRKYTIRRRAGTEFSFKADMDQPPPPKRPCDEGWYVPLYPGYDFELHVKGYQYKDSWTPGQVKALTCTVGEGEVRISSEGDKTVHLLFIVITEPMSAEEIQACAHLHTHSEEGQCWGGGSGSCCVEILRICDDCGGVTDKSYDNRD